MSKELREEVNIGRYIGLGILLLVVIIALFGSFYIVPTGHRGVVQTFGKPTMAPSEEGLHFKIPIAQSITNMEVRTKKIEVEADSSSKDLQDVKTTIALNYHLSPESTPRLFQEIGLDYENRIINPAIQEGIKAISARFTAEELVTKRASVRDDVKAFLVERLSNRNIIVDDFNIVNFQFSEEFDKAIEQKVTAEQLKLKADRDLERIKVEAQQKIAQAEAEAQALKLQKMEITEELVRLREIEMMNKAIDKWDGVMPQATSGMPFIDVSPTGRGTTQ